MAGLEAPQVVELARTDRLQQLRNDLAYDAVEPQHLSLPGRVGQTIGEHLSLTKDQGARVAVCQQLRFACSGSRMTPDELPEEQQHDPQSSPHSIQPCTARGATLQQATFLNGATAFVKRMCQVPLENGVIPLKIRCGEETEQIMIDKLIGKLERDGVSRRELAAGIAAATAGLAVTTGAARAQPLGARPGSAVTLVPGAEGNGADDFQAIQDAIDAAAALGGGRVILTQPLLTGAPLTMRSGVELVGESRLGCTLAPHGNFSRSSLIEIEPDASHVTIRELAFLTDGRISRALIDVGAGCNHILISELRLSGWSAATAAVSGVRCDAAPDPFGSNTFVRHITVENCEFDDFGNGVKISHGAQHIAVRNCTFRRMHRRCIWFLGRDGYICRHIQIVGNTMVDFPLETGQSNPIHFAFLGDPTWTEHVLISGNVIVGNGSYHGPGGFGTADQFFMKCVRMAHVSGNTSVDGGESGFTFRDCSDVVAVGNAAVRSDVSGFGVINKDAPSWGMQFIGNTAWNNGQNRGGAGWTPVVRAGFLVRRAPFGIFDAQFMSNRAWDDQAVKTQAYGLAIDDPAVSKTLLTGNHWRDAQHEIAALFNRGTATRQPLYVPVPED